MENYIERYGDLEFYRLSSGTLIPVYADEVRKNLHDWCSIEPEDFDTGEEDEGED